MRSMIKHILYSLLAVTLAVPCASADYQLKVKPGGYLQTYNVGDVITFSVILDLRESGPGGDDLYDWSFTIAFDNEELGWVNPEAPDRGVNIILHVPASWETYPTGGPVFHTSPPQGPKPTGYGDDNNSIVMINASKDIGTSPGDPQGPDWHVSGEIVLARFNLKLIKTNPWDNQADVWARQSEIKGESFGFRNRGIGPVPSAPFPAGGPDFGTPSVSQHWHLSDLERHEQQIKSGVEQEPENQSSVVDTLDSTLGPLAESLPSAEATGAVTSTPKTAGAGQIRSAAPGPYDTDRETLDQSRMISEFKREALEKLPLVTVICADPLHPDDRGLPLKNHVWIRIKAERSGEAESIMAEVAAMYKNTMNTSSPVNVQLWVGGRALAEMVY